MLWVDGLAGLSVGIGVLLLGGWLSNLHGLPKQLLHFTGVVNVLYGLYSTTLATRRQRPAKLITLLVIANLAWVPVCLGLAYFYRDSATIFGFVHLLGEAAFVGGLALLEWKSRAFLCGNS